MNALKKIPVWAWAALAVVVLYLMSKRHAAAAPSYATSGPPGPQLTTPPPAQLAPSGPMVGIGGVLDGGAVGDVTGLLGNTGIMPPKIQNWMPLSGGTVDANGPVYSPPPPPDALQ